MADIKPTTARATGFNRLFLRKSVEQMHADHAQGELKRTLGALNLVLLGIGCIIGTGIFVLTGRAAANFAGPGIVISFIITGLLCTFVALCYAELASAIPVSGSAYSYSYASMGEIVAWVMGLLLLLEYGLAASTVAVGWSGYLVSLLHSLSITIPPEFTAAPGAFVAARDIHLVITDPVVDLKGVTTLLANGDTATFHDSALAVLKGAHEIDIKAYSTIGDAKLDLNGASSAILQSGAEAVNKITNAPQSFASGVQLAFAEGVKMKAAVPMDDVIALAGTDAVKSAFNLPALLAIGAVTTLLVVGVSESATVNNVVVFIKLSVVLAFIAIGIFYVKPELWTPLIPAQEPAPPPGSDMSMWGQIWRAMGDVITGQNDVKYGVGGLIAGAATIFFAYIGFEAVSTAGAESKNPAKDMPIGILGSLLICTILYILTAGILVGIVPYTELDNPAPIAMAVNQIGLPWFAILIKVGAIAGLSSVMLVLLYGQTRIFYTMARDGLLPSIFADVHPKFKTPWVNTIVVGIVAACFAGFMSLDALANLTNVGSLMAFAIVCATVMYLRVAHPDLQRPFKTPLFPIVPILGAVMCLFLLMALMAHDATRNFFLIYLVGGLVVYFAYGIRKSKLGQGIVVEGSEPDLSLPQKLD